MAQLAVGDAVFWVHDEAPDHGNYSPESRRGRTVRLTLIVDDPDAVLARAVELGATELASVHDEHGWRLAASATRSAIRGRSATPRASGRRPPSEA